MFVTPVFAKTVIVHPSINPIFSYFYNSPNESMGNLIIHPRKIYSNIVHINIDHKSFSPEIVKIKKGTTVIWKNSYQRMHIIRDFNNTFFSNKILHGDLYNHTFNKSGTYNYRDIIYNWRGKIIVS